MKQVTSVLVIFLMLNAAIAQNLKPWKVKLEAGQKMKVSNTSTNNLSQDMMGQKFQINIAADISDSIYVITWSTDSFTITKTTTHIKMDMDIMGQQKNFDSDKKEDMEGELGEKLKDKIGVVIHATINGNGNVKITSEAEEKQVDAMSAMMPLNNDSALIAGYFLMAPTKKIKAGETWKDSVITPESSIETVYSFIKTENSIAFISFEMKGSSVGTSSTNGMEVKTKTNTEGKGTLKVELSTGLVLERYTETKLTGTSEVMGMEIPMNGETKTTILITKL